MGRRSRKRGGGGTPLLAERPAAERPRAQRAAARDERPRAPWHPFPLVELCVLVGLVLLVLGFVRLPERDGRVLLVLGMVLGSLGGLDTALRDHFGGFRSHTTLLAGVPAVAAAGVLFFVQAPWIAVVGAALVVFAASFAVLRRAFQSRSGGLSWR